MASKTRMQPPAQHAQNSRGTAVAKEPAGRPAEDLVNYARQYARERPDVVALWCFGVGFVLGWKLKPW